MADRKIRKVNGQKSNADEHQKGGNKVKNIRFSFGDKISNSRNDDDIDAGQKSVVACRGIFEADGLQHIADKQHRANEQTRQK